MKKILASLFVTSVTICSASAANAALEGTSTHSGTVPSECDVVATGASLVYVATSPTEISSETGNGNFNIKCNSKHKLTIEQLPIAEGTNRPALPAGATYTAQFQLSGAPTPDYGVLNVNFGTTAVVGTDLKQGEYNVKVAAKGAITGAAKLPSGTYKIEVKATLVAS